MSSRGRCARVLRRAVVLSGTLLVAACSRGPEAAVGKVIPRRDDALARQFLETLRRGDVAAAERSIAPDVAGPQAEVGLRQIVGVLQGRRADATRLVDFEIFYGSESKRINLTYESSYGDGWVLSTIGIIDSAGTPRIFGARARGIPAAAAARNAFTFRGKSWVHYVFLLGVILVPAFIIYTLWVVLRSGMRRRWLWALLALVTAMQFRLDWTTGGMMARFVSVQIFGLGVVRSGGPYMPWIVTVSLPVGAFVALLRLRRWRGARAAEPRATVAPAPAPTEAT